MNELPGRIRLAMDDMRVADVHTHFPTRGLRQARTLADIVSYHWLATELTRAAEREFEASPHRDPEAYLREVVPHFEAIRNTSNLWMAASTAFIKSGSMMTSALM